jgi:dipeptidyl-peptidase-4
MGYPGQATANPYPTFLDIRYPKVGTTNPTVAFNLLDLADREAGPKKIEYEAFGQDDTIIGEVAWVTDNSSHVIFRAFNRVQDQEKLLLVDTSDSSVTVVRERDGRPGWIDNNIAIKFIPGTGNYVDLSDESGWSHLYLYGIFGSKPKAITRSVSFSEQHPFSKLHNLPDISLREYGFIGDAP